LQTQGEPVCHACSHFISLSLRYKGERM